MDPERLRLRMVAQQLAARDITDPRVLDVMRRVPRDRFVPAGVRHRAYDDCALPIGLKQTISQPYMVALMTQHLQLEPTHRVLEIGTGSGYQTAVLAELAAQVYTVERLADLSAGARQTLAELGHSHIRFRVGDGTLGWPEQAPFDRIMVTAVAPDIPRSLNAQLDDDGTIVLPAGEGQWQTLYRVRKARGALRKQAVCRCVFVRLVGQEGWPVPDSGPAGPG